MSFDRKRSKGRFSGIPHSVQNTEHYARLGSSEVKLLIDLMLQYNGRNNGMMSPCHALLRKQGWAKSSLYRAYSRLEHAGFLVVTRRGLKIRGMATLVAITWNGIDEPIKVSFDEEIKPHPAPLNYWCKPKSTWKHKPKLKEN
ncbi:MAG: hypothetical protein KUG78_21935 [Kangiellaceae bacterium]|nr:hypothetical protein [Kangiellaceae bacterium]